MSNTEQNNKNNIRPLGQIIKTPKKSVIPRSRKQAEYLEALINEKIIVSLGPAGTGKSYLAVSVGVKMLMEKKVERVILSRPAVEAGERLGFLPGELSSKIQQYNESTFTILDKIIGKEKANKMISDGKLEIGVVNFLRGCNLENCYVILDEAQNVSPMQIKTLVTRLDENCKMIIQGDLSQCDKYKTNGVTNYEKSGFYDMWFRTKKMDGVNHMEFSRDDCIRHPLVKRVLRTYEDEHQIKL